MHLSFASGMDASVLLRKELKARSDWNNYIETGDCRCPSFHASFTSASTHTNSRIMIPIFVVTYKVKINTTKDSLTTDRRAVRLLARPCVGHIPFASLRSRVAGSTFARGGSSLEGKSEGR